MHADEREGEAVTQTPKATGTAAAATWPASFSHQRRPRKSSIAPTVVASAAPSSSPRVPLSELEERERRDDEAEEEREPAEARHGERLTRRPPGPVDDAEQPRHPADRRGQRDDDHERDHGAVDDLEVVGERSPTSRRYFVP